MRPWSTRSCDTTASTSVRWTSSARSRRRKAERDGTSTSRAGPRPRDSLLHRVVARLHAGGERLVVLASQPLDLRIVLSALRAHLLLVLSLFGAHLLLVLLLPFTLIVSLAYRSTDATDRCTGRRTLAGVT